MIISANLIIISFILLTCLMAISVLLLHKIRRIHLAMFSLQADAAATHKETESLFAQVQALFALEKKLVLSEALPPMRGWAGSPDFLLAVSEAVTERKPQCVMECSSGVSTIVVARSLQMNGYGHVFSLEHDPVYAEKTRKLIERYGLSGWATVIDAPLCMNSEGALWYAEKAIPSSLSEIELLVVDGPPENISTLARFPALPTLIHRLANNYVVMLDDADRPSELEMVRKWMQMFPELKRKYENLEKGLVIISNNNF
jgi:hypothetical protein